MEFLQSYQDDDDEDSSQNLISTGSSPPQISQSTPNITNPIDPVQQEVSFNPSYNQLYTPIYGPNDPYSSYGISRDMRNHKLGFVENVAVDGFMFDQQYNYGYYGNNNNNNNYVGDLVSMDNAKSDENNKRKERELGGKKEGLTAMELAELQKKYREEHAAKKARKEKGGGRSKGEVVIEKSIFHGKEERDYQGRSWVVPPTYARKMNDICYLPKRCIHTWNGHTGGVSAIRFFPKYGHLLLSAGMDKKVKIWDVFNEKNCMRTYIGHGETVRDISFSNDGTKFLSASYDKVIMYWDTETGQVITSFPVGNYPNVVKLNPDDDKQNVLLAGMSDKRIIQWDLNTGKLTQTYGEHMGGVNTITFVDDNRKFVTSSDDLSLRVWEFGIPVSVKTISEPHMHSMPSIALHPSSSWLAALSMDNQILVYSAGDKFQKNTKKRFGGVTVAGHTCRVNFSPDGQYVMSGDGEGKCWFWDWKTCKRLRPLKCHVGDCVGCEWHPLEQSKVATCGRDGLIKYWD
ncbi:hypothetical protein ACHQM5_027857 [Ranunculus cassubicifolius]